MKRERVMSMTNLHRVAWLPVVLACAGLQLARPVPAEACGGFFCGRMPVDQTAERIVFRVHDDKTTMIVQVAYQGLAEDFAWVLPLGSVPAVDSLAVFPQRALTGLDANTGPQFQMPNECQRWLFDGNVAAGGAAGSGAPTSAPPTVTVHFRTEVGPYNVAAIESEDPMALYEWLVNEDYNVNEVMQPYIRAYTSEGMKFLALKLKKDAETSDIQPFAFDLPGTSPGIPLRMTALAAEPEMGVLVFVLADQRYAGANWPNIEIPDDKIKFRQDTWPLQTNWTALVARGVDAAGGQGWVTELAGSTQPILQALDNSFFATPEDEEAGMALRSLIGDATYVTRMYSRLSAEEMTSDPIFRRDQGGDVSNLRQLSRIIDGEDQCPDVPVSPDPCVFTSCGAGGICRPVMLDGATQPVAGCGCLSAAAARTTFDPVGLSLQADGSPGAIVVCQDARMSFINPGDEMPSGQSMPDPCVSFDCGPNGSCLSMNMTPTCVCDEGYVAVGSFGNDGTRQTSCKKPMIPVPSEFYMQRLPDLPQELPGGRAMASSDDLPVVQPSMDDLGSNGMPVPRGDGGDGGDDGDKPSGGSAGLPSTGGAGMTGSTAKSSSGDSGCSVAAPGTRAPGTRVPGTLAALMLSTGLGLLPARSRRRR
jgi:hypothetical protein